MLRELGYRVRLHMTAFASISAAMRRNFQLSVDGDWVAEYPEPSAYLPQFFGCRGGTSNGYVCRPDLDRDMARAVALGPNQPASANALWTRIDHRLTDDAAWVPTVAEREVEGHFRAAAQLPVQPGAGLPGGPELAAVMPRQKGEQNTVTEPTTHTFTAEDGLTLAYHEVGSGRPVVLLHGYISAALETWMRSGAAARAAWPRGGG